METQKQENRAKNKANKARKPEKATKTSKAGAGKKTKLNKKKYEKELFKLQIELCKLQDWVKEKGMRAVVIFEGRDAAGKGGIIKRITQLVSPRVFRLVALPAPSDREKTQLNIQRYIPHLPAAGEIVLFDRSWYNRAGVERVMGFCTDDECDRFIQNCPAFERVLVESGIILLKYWLTVTNEEQQRRFEARIDDPTKRWKLSPMDLESRRRWYAYSRARDEMLDATDTQHAPWYIVDSNDKRRARLNCISHLLSMIPYEALPYTPGKLPKRDHKGRYNDELALANRHFIPEKY